MPGSGGDGFPGGRHDGDGFPDARSDGDQTGDGSGNSGPVPDGLPPHLHDVWRGSEETPAGRSFFGPDEQGMRDLAQRVPADPHRFVVDGHGDANGMWTGGQRLSVDDVADLIRNDPNWNGREVLLISCHTGQGDFAQQLAQRLGVPVTAPTTQAWTDRQGRVFASDATTRRDGETEPTWPPNGSWNTHHPDGTTTPSGADGFPAPADPSRAGRDGRDGDAPPEGAAPRAADPPPAAQPAPDPQQRPADEPAQRIQDDPRVQRMLDQAGEPLGDQLRAELRDVLPAHPDLARIIEGTGPPPLTDLERGLRESLLSRPKTLHSLLSHPEAIPVLEHAVAEVNRLGPDAILNGDGPTAQPTPLTDEQRAASQALADSVTAGRRPGEDPSPRVAPDQPGFDPSQVGDRTDREDRYINRYLDGLYQAMRDSVPVLRDLVNDPAIREAGGDPHLRPGEKDRVRALDKIFGDYQGDPSRLSDLLGAKIQFSTVDGLYRALGDIQQIAARHGVEIVSVKDRMQNPQASGYRDVQMTVRMPNGHIGELRLHLRSIDDVASYEHALYEVRRDLPMTAADQNRPLTPEEAALDRAINQQVITRFQDALQQALGPSTGTRLTGDAGDAPPPQAENRPRVTDQPSPATDAPPPEPRQTDDAPGPSRSSDPAAALPPHLRDVWRNSAETPAGRSFFDPSEQGMRDLARRVPADPQRFVVDGHGDADGMRMGDRRLSVDDVADLIRNDPNWNGREVLLISCDTAQGDFARQLAQRLGVPVTAPTTQAWTDRQGRVFATDPTPGPDGRNEPTWPPNGTWNTHHPDGTTRTAGHDGSPTGTLDPGQAPPPGTAAARSADDTPPSRTSDELMRRVLENGRVQQAIESVRDKPYNEQGDKLGDLLERELRDQLPGHPGLARILEGEGPPPLSSLEESVRESLLARPKTMHSLLSHPEAIPILLDAINDVHEQGPEAFAENYEPRVTPTEPHHEAISEEVSREVGRTKSPDQPGFDPAQVRDRTDREDAYITAYVNELYGQARSQTGVLADILRTLGDDTGGTPRMRPGEKDRVRADDKVFGDYQGRPQRLSDLLGGIVQYDSVDRLYDGLREVRALAELHGAEIVAVKDRLMNPVDSGYRDVQMSIRMPNGHIGELRLHLASIDSVSSYEHALYEVKRDFPNVARELADLGQRDAELTPEEKALIEAVTRRTQQIFWSALQHSLPEHERDDRWHVP
ncbi:MAG TPA: hypothetical protein VHJ17_20705 [Thermomonospora sp.]|nr:hypothetical protein [Thermomonospora sp.]